MSFEDLEAGYRIEPRRMMNGSQDVTQAIASGIFQINTAVSRFQRLVKTLGTPNDTPEFRQKLNKTRLDICQLVSITSDKLKQASETGHLDEVNASNKIRAAKLAKDFQAILKEYQKVQRFAAEKEIAFTPVAQQVVLPSIYTDGDIQEKGNKDLELQALVMDSRRQVVLQLDNDIAFNEAVIEEREQGIQEIHQQIGEVHEIFKDLAVLVHEQGTMINSIQSNIEGSRASTTEAKTQLVKAAKSQKSNSSLTCLVIVLFGVILLILVVLLVAL